MRAIAPYISDRINLDDLASSRPLLQLLDRDGPLAQAAAARALGVSPGACNLHVQRLEHAGLIRRIRENLLTLPDDTVVYSGHGPATRVGNERKFNPFLAE